MEIIQRLRASAAIVLVQMELHGRLVGIEWQQEKNRLQQMLVFSVLGLVFFTCCLFCIGLLVITLGWPTAYRLQTIAGVIVFYAAGATMCYLRCKHFSAQGANAFAGTRAEIAADVALIRSQL